MDAKRTRQVTWLALAAIGLLAAFLRFWNLGGLPPGLYHDEAYNGLDALSLLQGKTFPQFYEGWELYAQDAHADNPPVETRFPVFFEGNYGREPLHVYLMALSIALLGATPTAVRAVPALAGVLGVLATWWAARALLQGWWTQGERRAALLTTLVPLLAAFTLAVLYPAVHFSRFGLRVMLFVPVAALAVGCFWRGVNAAERQGRVWVWFAAAGLFLGLGIYTFAAARLLPLLWVLFVPLWLWRERGALRRFLGPLAVMALTALLVALPLLLFFWRYPYFFVFRIAYVANKGKGAVEGRPWQTWLLNVGRVVGGLLWQGETHLRHNLPGRPFLDPLQAFFFLAGVIRTVWRGLEPRRLFLLLWLAVMLLPSILSGDAPHFGRMMGAAVPAAILVALGAAWAAEWLAERLDGRLHGRGDAVVWAVVALAFGLSAWMTVRDYFGRYAAHPDLARDFYLDEWQMGLFAAGYPPETGLYLTPTQEELATIYFALQDPERLRNYNGAAGAIPAGVPGTPNLYLARPNNDTSLQLLQAYFPEGSMGLTMPTYLPFEVPADAPRNRAARAIAHEFGDGLALVGWETAQDADHLAVRLVWQRAQAGEPPAQSYTGFVHLVDGAGQVVAQLDRPPGGYPTGDWRPGEVVADLYTVDIAGLSPGTYTLVTGFYDPVTLERLGVAAVLGRMEIED